MKKVIRMFCRTSLIFLLIHFASFGALAQNASVTVDTARWNGNKDRLVMKGRSDTLNLVFLSDALILLCQIPSPGNRLFQCLFSILGVDSRLSFTMPFRHLS